MNSGIPFSPQNLETSHLGVLLYVLLVYWVDSGLASVRVGHIAQKAIRQTHHTKKDMKLVHFSKNDDWGTDYSVALITLGRYALFQGMICMGESPGWPYLSVSMGMGKLFEFCFDVHRFGVYFEIGAKQWVRPDGK